MDISLFLGISNVFISQAPTLILHILSKSLISTWVDLPSVS